MQGLMDDLAVSSFIFIQSRSAQGLEKVKLTMKKSD